MLSNWQNMPMSYPENKNLISILKIYVSAFCERDSSGTTPRSGVMERIARREAHRTSGAYAPKRLAQRY
jgi:hypothetical protein